MAFIEIRDLRKTYSSRRTGLIEALAGTSLDVSENEFVSIVGPSGCGKTTLLKLVGSLLEPSAGSICIDGRHPLEYPARFVGMVFQSPTLLPWRTVLANVLLPAEFHRLPVKEYKEKALRLLAKVDLKGFEDRVPGELSGGMQQRVAICRALLLDPKLLLMDEPFGALDAMTREEMALELLRIWDEFKTTVLFVTHSIPEAILLSDRVAVMTRRPAQVRKVVDIHIPRPRSLATEFTPRFKSYSDEIREAIFRP